MVKDIDQLFRLYHRDMQQMAYRRLGDREMAADLTQDTFLRYVSLARQQRTASIENPPFFLIRMLRNLIVDLARQGARRGNPLPLEGLQDELFDNQPSPERLLELRQQVQLLHQALGELPDNCRQALLLNRLDGLNHMAIAAQLGVSPSMVSKYIMRALRHCIRRLGWLDE